MSSSTFSSMAEKQKKNIPENAIDVEFKIYMHCNGCERTIAKIISKIKGVNKFVTDMNNNKVMITGKIDPLKVMKKLKKKTGKAVEMVVKEEDPEQEVKEEDSIEEMTNQTLNFLLRDYLGDDFFCTMFSDENANACAVM